MNRTAKRPQARLKGPGAPGAGGGLKPPVAPQATQPQGRPGLAARPPPGAPTSAPRAPRAGQPAAPGARGTARPGAPHHEAPQAWPGQPYRTSALGCTGPVCPRCGEFLSAVGNVVPGSEPPKFIWSLKPCTRCEEVKSMSINIQPGGAFKWPKFIEDWRATEKAPAVVEVTKAIAGRCRYLGDMRTVKEFKGAKVVAEHHVAMFLDEKTGEMYAQPVEKEG